MENLGEILCTKAFQPRIDIIDNLFLCEYFDNPATALGRLP